MKSDKTPPFIIPVYNKRDLTGSVLTDWIERLRLLKIDFDTHDERIYPHI